MSYFPFGDITQPPAHIVPDDGVTLTAGVANLNRLPPPSSYPTLRWRIGNNSDPDGTVFFRDYDNPGGPAGLSEPGGPGGFNAQIWVNVLNDYSLPEAPPYIAWGMDGFDEVAGNNWFYHLDTGWVLDNTSPVPIETRTIDRYDGIPPGFAWSAVNGISHGVAAPTPEWPYTPSVLNAGEGGWAVTRMGGR